MKVHGVAHSYEYKQRRSKVSGFLNECITCKNFRCKCSVYNVSFFSRQVYVCEDCGHTTKEPELHYLHLKEKHPFSPALLKFYDKRHFKFNNSSFASMLLSVNT
jgi:ovo-like protein